MKRIPFALLAVVAAALGWLGRGLARSVGMRHVAAALPNPAKRHGIDIRIPVDRGGWTRLTLTADLSASLSEVVGYPVEGAAYSHFGGFNLSPIYADFVNPDSDYYQAWLGAYVVFDNERRQHFGFDDEGQPVQQEALDVLEADQRLVLGGAACPNRFPDGRLVRPEPLVLADGDLHGMDPRGLDVAGVAVQVLPGRFRRDLDRAGRHRAQRACGPPAGQPTTDAAVG